MFQRFARRLGEDERADTLLSPASDDEQGGFKAQNAASGASNQTRIARRRAEEEGADTPFVGERRRSRRVLSAIRAERSGAVQYS